MKKYIILMILLVVAFIFRSDLYQLYQTYFLQGNKEVSLETTNDYAKKENFSYIQITDKFSPSNKQDILNIYYTVLDAGKEKFSFYCPSKYKRCLNDVIDIAHDQTALSTINNFVHPFNSFKNLETTYDNFGRVTITIEHTYSNKEIKLLEAKVESVEKEVWTPTMSDEEKIKAVHNYIINHSKYDSKRSDELVVEYQSESAYGPLLQGYSLCGGYTDAMALFLDDLNVKNYKIASENHVWNAVFLHQQWLHLDLTWDDPVTTDGSDILEYNFFLITTEELKEIENEQHHYDEAIYKEMQ